MKLLSNIGMLHKLEMLQVNANYSKSQLPYEIGSSPFLKSLTLSITDVDEVPKIIGKLPCL